MRNQTFFNWLRENTKRSPSKKTDNLILKYSGEHLKPEDKFSFWKLSGSAILGSCAVVLFLIFKTPTPQPGSAMISEAPEMILNYNEIELMADASTLSEADWAKINGNK